MIPTNRVTPHPGDILNEEFIASGEISIERLAAFLAEDVGYAKELLKGKISVSDGMAARISMLTGVSAQFWMNLQRDYDFTSKREAINHEN